MDWQKDPPKKVLIVNIFGIGDVLFTTPLVANLKELNPAMSVGYLVNRRTVCVLTGNPQVDRIFVYERDELMAVCRRSKVQYLKELLKLVSAIKHERYEAVIDVSLNRFTSFLTFALGIRQRIGFNFKNRGFWLTEKIPLIAYEDRHVVEHYFDLLKRLNVPVAKKDLALFISEQDKQWAAAFWAQEGVAADRPTVGLFPGGGESWGKDAVYKRWPAQSYAKLADNLVEKHRCSIILFGGENEVELCSEVQRQMQTKAHLSCGKTSITQFAALAQRCAGVVLNDGGPLHVAVAAGVKTVSIFGPVDEIVYGPYPAQGNSVVKKGLPCQPCYRRFKRAHCEHVSCLKDLEVSQVLAQVKKLL